MSSQYWKGGATLATEVDAWVWSSLNATDIVTFTIYGENNVAITTVPVTVPSTPTSTNTTSAAIAAWNANTVAAAYGTAGGTTIFTVTDLTSGTPMQIVATTSGTSTATKQSAGTNGAVANSGPNDWASAANWSGGTVPVSSDVITTDQRGSQSDILYGLYQSGVTLASLTVLPGSPSIGQSVIPLAISSTIINVPVPNGTGLTGVKRLNINTGTNATTTTIAYSAISSVDAGQEPIRITGAHASNVLIQTGGLVGLGTNLPSDAPNFPTMSVNGGTLNLGIGVVSGQTLTAISGTVNANNRPGSGSAFSSIVFAGPAGVTPLVDFSGNPTACTIASITPGNGKIKVASAAQITFTATVPVFGNYRTLQWGLT